MSESLFSADYPERRARVPKGLPLVIAFTGFTDAGSATAQLETRLWEQCEPEELIRFNADLLLDYRARRPSITFAEDHLIDYSPDELSLSLAHDAMGAPFLMLTGYEPDFRWEQFVDTVLLLVHDFEVSVTAWVHAIPMPIPHTRPLVYTVSGSREDLIESRSAWRPTTRLSATVGHLLEYRLHSLGEDVVGLILLVPHYLANTQYPATLLIALEGLMAATGLIFTTDPVREELRAFVKKVDEQISSNPESREMVANLEARYDTYMEDQSTRSPLIGWDGSIPTADQLASELERFLAQQPRTGSDGSAGGSASSPDVQ
jgi:hypothetical protein